MDLFHASTAQIQVAFSASGSGMISAGFHLALPRLGEGSGPVSWVGRGGLFVKTQSFEQLAKEFDSKGQLVNLLILPRLPPDIGVGRQGLQKEVEVRLPR